MKLIVFGATGGTGRHLLTQALHLGHEVSVLCRYPEKISTQHKRLKILQGDSLDAEAVSAAVQGQEAVLCALGMPSVRDKSRLRTQATQHIIQAMHHHGIKRLLCLSAFGAGDSFKHLPFHYRHVLVPLFMKPLYDDHNGQEQSVMQSDLDWTLIRPAILNDGKPIHHYQHGTSLLPSARLKISRADVADFMLQQLTHSAYLRQAATISE